VRVRAAPLPICSDRDADLDGTERQPHCALTSHRFSQVTTTRTSRHARSYATPPPSPDAPEPTGDQRLRSAVRTVMRNVPSPVVVLTAAASEDIHGSPTVVPVGVAVSSFNTVTLDPPTISLNLKHPSRTLDAIRADRGRFRVHVLRGTGYSAKLADAFTTGNHPRAYEARQRLAKFHMGDGQEPAKAAHIEHPDVYASLECEVVQELTVADHVIVVAKVLDTEHAPEQWSTLMYVDGNYTLPGGETLMPRTVIAISEPEKHILWGLPPAGVPILPNYRDRQQYNDRLVNWIRSKPELLDMGRHAAYHISTQLDIPMEVHGVSLERAIAEAAELENRPPDQDSFGMESPAFCEFYGPLDPFQINVIIQRAKTLVKNDPLFLSLPASRFFQYIQTSPYIRNLLAGDVMEALREKGLAPPFQPRQPIKPKKKPKKGDGSRIVYTLEELERSEQTMREYIKTRGVGMLLMNPNDFAAAAGIDGWSRVWAKQVRIRLFVEAFPHLYTSDKIDLVGRQWRPHLNQEARVAISRIHKFVEQFAGHSQHKLYLPWFEILRICKIHPLIAGFDARLFIKRLKHLVKHTTTSRFLEMVDELVLPKRNPDLTLSDIQKRVTHLVLHFPVLAATADRWELLAALHLHPDDTIKMPDAVEDDATLKTSPVLDRELVKAMEEQYSQFSPETKRAVDECIAHPDSVARSYFHIQDSGIKRLNFRYVSPAVPQLTEEEEDTQIKTAMSSAQEMRAALLAAGMGVPELKMVGERPAKEYVGPVRKVVLNNQEGYGRFGGERKAVGDGGGSGGGRKGSDLVAYGFDGERK
jgi:flavin reductase (DIM6/NTAB) family NADH-FMN oxidoreductase RutF